MLEALTLAKKKPTGILDIHFEDLPVGALALGGNTGGYPWELKAGTGTKIGNAGVVDDPTYGKCMYLDGIAYFQSNVLPMIYNKSYRITCNFVAMANTAPRCVFGTGDYNPIPNAGANLSVGSIPSQYIQYFQCNGNGFQRNVIDGPQAPGLEQVVIEQDIVKRILTMTNLRTGKSSVNPYFATGETFFRLGMAQNPAGYGFIGLIKKFKIELP